VRQFIVRCDDRSMTGSVELLSSGAAKNLQNVQDANVDKSAAFGVVDLRAFDDHSVSW
jgi:hypothetical protein